MKATRHLAPWKNSDGKMAVYHVTSRVVEKLHHFGSEEREGFRKFMRMYEKFSGCRVQAYCVMSNHFHILLEVPPRKEITDKSLLRRLGCLYSQGFVAEVAAELAQARAENDEGWAAKIHTRFTYRMYDLSEFMKGLLIRFTRWFNRLKKRKGTLWEARFNSVIVESGTAARVVAAYIDLNPVRANLVERAEDYRWSSYGEAMGGGVRGNGKKAREGLMRVVFSNLEPHQKKGEWQEAHAEYQMLMGFALERKPGENGNKTAAQEGKKSDFARMLRNRVRYFTAGAVIGSQNFVNEVFAASRDRYGSKRKDGARKIKGVSPEIAQKLWSLRDLAVPKNDGCA